MYKHAADILQFFFTTLARVKCVNPSNMSNRDGASNHDFDLLEYILSSPQN